MKLRNKKTGQLGNFIINRDHFECVDLDYVPEYRNLAELNAEWCDVPKEPKEYWYINSDSVIYATDCGKYPDSDLLRKEIGNYFDTKEEAEQAVEKLKAWKRLKDAGLKFGTIKYNLDDESSSTIVYDGIITIKGMAYEDFVDDLDLLFGGEE